MEIHNKNMNLSKYSMKTTIYCIIRMSNIKSTFIEKQILKVEGFKSNLVVSIVFTPKTKYIIFRGVNSNTPNTFFSC